MMLLHGLLKRQLSKMVSTGRWVFTRRLVRQIVKTVKESKDQE